VNDPLHIARLRARDLKGEIELELASPTIEAPKVFRFIAQTFDEVANWLERYELLDVEPLFVPALLSLALLVDKLEAHLAASQETYADWMRSNLGRIKAVLSEELGLPTAGQVGVKEFKI